MKTPKEQFNVRLCPRLKEAAKVVCDELTYTRDELAEVALATLFGSTDGVIREKRKKIAEKARQLSLSFDCPDGQPGGFELAA